ncbi:MAG: hypothetical protein QG639_165 [Patescibacteria group bacterium]|nr:hypothetical protein [Patescibacteria group bacterium]
MSTYGSFENMAAAMQQGIYHEPEEVMAESDETADEVSAQSLLQVIAGQESIEEDSV